MSATDNGDNQPVNIPLFLKKLWKMVNDKDNQDIISWNSTGDGFVIHDAVQFIMKLLPHYFKHNNLSSFVRQLNFYDFHKIASTEKDEMQFAHHYFLKDLPETLVFITRKVPNLKPRFSKEVDEEDMKNILNGMKDIKSKHNLVDKELKLLKQENNTLWSEINNLRVKYSKQTKIINKLIHFLISYIHQNQYGRRTPNVIKKNNPRNINSRPSLLEIGYKPSQLKGVAEKYLQPGSSGALIYDVDSSDDNIQEQLNSEEALDNILNIKTEDIGDDSTYSVQFPNSPSRVVEDINMDGETDSFPLEEIIDEQQTDIPFEEQTAEPEMESRKLAQISRNNTLEDVYQIKNPASNTITYSIKYPKIHALPKKRVSQPAITQAEVAPKKMKIHSVVSVPPLQSAQPVREDKTHRSSVPRLNQMVLPRKQAALLADLVSTSGIKQVPTTLSSSLRFQQAATSRGSQKEKADPNLHQVSKQTKSLKSQLQPGTARQGLEQIGKSKLKKQAVRQKHDGASLQRSSPQTHRSQVPQLVSQLSPKTTQPISTQRESQAATKQPTNMPQLIINQNSDKSPLERDETSVASPYTGQIASGSQQDKRQAAREKPIQQRAVPEKKISSKTLQPPLVSSKQLKQNIRRPKNVQCQNSEASELERGADSSSGSTSAIAGSSTSETTLNDLLIDADVLSDLPTRLPSQVSETKFNILENPKAQLSQYVDSTQSELDSLYDVLGTLSSKEWESILNELTPLNDESAITEALDDICDVAIDEEKDHLHDDDVDTIKHELEEQLENMPSIQQTEEEVEDLVDEYLNTDFTQPSC
ncbi:unnamed protein product [Acanthoscelides obtectus]|uniref:HSF-type DNA-binding domain-containing protein n=1 Tax=Acanthoscelides obtectus TaxID=200917 RepID=A0A9P0JY42_ACAOB|nr:unnamed protein product [Acanthoscelides obtectus]CAK1631501.1 Heat shock factor protein 1 [Acanthoscelides obtectus]